MSEPLRILAIDVGAGTQDILLYESDRTIENCVKLVLPSQTQVIAKRIRAATAAGKAIALTGSLMGGGATSAAVSGHLEAGLALYATHDAARTLHNDLDRVRDLGVVVTDDLPVDVDTIEMADVDLHALSSALENFGVRLPQLIAIAVQDHGYQPNSGGREFRYEFLQSLLARGGRPLSMVFRKPPDYMIRMRAVTDLVPGAVVMDTGSAAVLGVLGDPAVAEAAAGPGAVLVNIGNMHTFGVAIRQDRIFGLFEHHTGGVTPAVLRDLIEQLQAGTLTHQDVVAQGGHGAAFAPGYGDAGPFGFVAVTGPNRRIARPLGYHQAAPHGDMMLAGPFGLVEGVLRLLASEGYVLPSESLVGQVD